jgi:nicotinamidase-related amidase
MTSKLSTDQEKKWQKGIDRMLHDVGEMPIEPDKSVLLVVDMQYYACSPDYGILKTYLESDPEAASYCANRLGLVVSNCYRLLRFFRKHKLRVFHATYGALLPDGSDLHPLRRMRLNEVPAYGTNDFEYQIMEKLKPRHEELVIQKSTRSAFACTSLDHELRMLGIKTVVIVGAFTDVCVSSTARSAWDYGYNVVLIDDATSALTEEDQMYTLRNWKAYFGPVMDTNELIHDFTAKL